MRDFYTPSPGLPQDLSCRKKIIQEDSEACLPPIATFSHRRESDTDETFKRLNSEVIKNAVYHVWPQCRRFFLKKQISNLEHRSHPHKNQLSLLCSQCGRRFSSKENLRRHMNMHLGLKPYICQVCHRAYSRTSERSRCMKKHHHEENIFKNNKQCSYNVHKDWSSSGLSALQIEDKIDQCRPRPYVCQICDDHRAYTDPSSLRKHMRSFHAGLKSEKSTKKDSDSVRKPSLNPANSKIPICDEPISLVLDNPTIDMDASYETAFTSEITTVPTSRQPFSKSLSPSSYHNTVDMSMTSDTSTKNIMNITTVVVTGSDVSSNIVTAPTYQLILGSSFHPTYDTVTLANSFGSSVMATTITTTTTTMAVTTVSRSEYDSEAAVDLCNSALCLQVYSDKIYPSLLSTELERIDSSSLPLSIANPPSLISQYVTQTNKSVDNGMTSKSLFYSNSGLDLTDTQYFTLTGPSEAIDLSAEPPVDIITVNPIDLSASHQCTMFFNSTNNCSDNSFFTTHTIWDPEPGFSFTDLLLTNNNDDDDRVETSVEYPEVIVYPESNVSMDYRFNEINISCNTTTHNHKMNVNRQLCVPNLLIPSCNDYYFPLCSVTTTTASTTRTVGAHIVQPPPLDLRLIQTNFYS
ncbi:unnamed protein product [Heterobilharzia americana]|nr:unnamed protein product [Heterobilharzia americana]